MARTAAEFDDWFRRSGGDPWGYESAFVQDRLGATIRFVGSSVHRDFRGTFLELGMFNGEFTERLAAHYPHALIAASDISPVAVEAARGRLRHLSNVRIHVADMADLEPPPGLQLPVNVLILECIYYLREDERERAIAWLVKVADRPDVFIGCPITGTPYPTERWLVTTFAKLGYRCVAAKALNYRPPRLMKAIGALTAIAPIRRRIANQAVYLFKAS